MQISKWTHKDYSFSLAPKQILNRILTMLQTENANCWRETDCLLVTIIPLSGHLGSGAEEAVSIKDRK